MGQCISSVLVKGGNSSRLPPTFALESRSKVQVQSTELTYQNVLQGLLNHGCTDLSSQIDPDGYSTYPNNGGGCGDVYKGKMRDGRDIAVKIWRLFSDVDPSKVMKRSMREIYTWSKLKHDNIHELMGVTELHGRLGMVSLWMENGDLRSYIIKNPNTSRNPWCIQVATGVFYLHWNEMIHGDLKASNILVSEDGTAKIGDFDCALLSDGSVSFSTTGEPRHTLRWAAPELLSDSNCEAGVVMKTKQSDIYALGMTLLEIKTGRPPYAEFGDHNSVLSALSQARFPNRPEELGDALWNLLMECWDRDPRVRPDARRALKLLEVALEPFEVKKPEPAVISRGMSAQDMLEVLINHGCYDLTLQMKPGYDTSFPVSSGGNGDTWMGELNDGTRVVIKTWRGALLEHSNYKILKRAAREIYHWSRLKHDHIHELMGVVIFRDQLGIVSQWMENGNLREYLRQNSWANHYQLCLQITSGLAYMHSQGMIHGDLKAVNVLVSLEGVAKLSEFDFSFIFEATLVFTQTTNTHTGSLRWMAPEMILEDMIGPNKPADVYALGMTMLEIFTGQVPYPQWLTDLQVISGVMRQPRILPPRPTDQLKDNERDDMMWEQLLRCWSLDSSARPSAAELLKSLKTILSMHS